MRVVFLGGPLDGAVASKSQSPAFVFVDDQLRFCRSTQRRGHLYRADGSTRERCWDFRASEYRKVVVQRYFYAGHTHAQCCDAFHQLCDADGQRYAEPHCSLCHRPLHAVA